MLVMMAPARNVRPCLPPGLAPTRAPFASEAQQLADAVREYDPWQLESILDVDAPRALELFHAYQAFNADLPGTPALFSYYGAAFRNMNPADFDDADLRFAQEHFRFLSALYGMLRPLDGVLNHRLGMNFRPHGQDLYAFWGDRIYKEIYRGAGMLVNLASTEYAKLVTAHRSAKDEMITCRFLVQKQGRARGTVSTVRIARGQMARYIVKNKIDRPEGLKGFNWEGYRFIDGLSDAWTYVFVQTLGF